MPNDAALPPIGGQQAGLHDTVVAAALEGLTATPKTLPPWLFYDEAGCKLFYDITRLPEYYLTRTEASILGAHAAEMVPAGLQDAELVEFGASSEAKALYLLDLTDADGKKPFSTFIPVDVATAELLAMQSRLRHSHPWLRVIPVAADFMQTVRLPPAEGPRFGYFPGSTIGNLDPDAAVQFLTRTATALGKDAWLLLGADLRKDEAVLLPAYNDAAGVTAAFNLNLLHRLNREAGATFDVGGFRHAAIWNDAASRIEMHLIATRAQTVRVGGQQVGFREGESIHTENSYKHTADAITAMARQGGWQLRQRWTDEAGWFGVFLFQAS